MSTITSQCINCGGINYCEPECTKPNQSMSTPNLEQIARDLAARLRQSVFDAYGVGIDLYNPIIEYLRSVAQPEPKPRYHTTTSTEMDPHPGFLSSPQPEPKRFPAEKGTGEVPTQLHEAVLGMVKGWINANQINLHDAIWPKAAAQLRLSLDIMQAIAPFVAGGEDTKRLADAAEYLEEAVGDIAGSCSIEGDPEDAADTLQWIQRRANQAMEQWNAARAATTPSEGREK